jgi:glycine/D-amino acid oxidase-like deaminating enzyme
MKNKYDVIIIGGGFYGCNIAIMMREFYDRVLIIEKGHDLMQRASAINQARVHNGYHYPRNIITAQRSHVNFGKFNIDFSESIHDKFLKLYAIAKNGSKVNASQFYKIFKNIGSYIDTAAQKFKKLFNHDLIEEVFTVHEVAFDHSILKKNLKTKLEDLKVEILYNTVVEKVETLGDDVKVILEDGKTLRAKKCFNCTYSNINKLLRKSSLPLLPMKHEFTEMALVDMPEELKTVGITIMDGPFFSCMPYPAEKLHSLSHVRYTPHFSWQDSEITVDGDSYLQGEKKTNYEYMLKDAKRYLPVLDKANYSKSIYEIKTVLLQNEVDDGRPILLRKDYGIKNFTIIMGGKLDNIYDVLEILRAELEQ